MKILVIIAFAIILNLGLAAGQETVKPEPSSKDIPKATLILGLFCNSALSSIKSNFDRKPEALPWKSNNRTRPLISAILEKLDFQGWGYAKAIKDGAIKASEAEFIKFTAIHETGDWMTNIARTCGDPSMDDLRYDNCLKESNSEVYKCYKQIMDQIKITR